MDDAVPGGDHGAGISSTPGATGHDLAGVTRFLAAVGVAALAVATRWVALPTAPAEWYGDISTLYEYVLAMRSGDLPPGYYSLGVGPLYPLVLRPFLAVLGTSYETVKFAGTVWSLVGLAVLFELARRLRSFDFALVTVTVASVSSGWLVFSRLGDVQALTPTLTVAVVTGTVLVVHCPRSWWLPVAVGVLAGAGVYLYGNTWILPLVPAVPIAVMWRRGRLPAHAPILFAGALTLVLLPFVVEVITSPSAFSGGHHAQRFVGWRRLIPDGFDGMWRSLVAYVGTGDLNYRGNVAGASHVDRASAILGIVGIATWLRGAHRELGLFLVATWVLLHVPASVAEREAIPSVSRTVAAAPLGALFVATGICTVGMWLRRRGARAEVRAVVVVGLVGAIAWLNLDRYVNAYLPRLPDGNAAVAGSIVALAHQQTGVVDVHLVGSAWTPGGLPEPKSIAYQLEPPRQLVEHVPGELTCSTITANARDALLVWSPDRALPSNAVEPCAHLFRTAELYGEDGRPLYFAVMLSAPEP